MTGMVLSGRIADCLFYAWVIRMMQFLKDESFSLTKWSRKFTDAKVYDFVFVIIDPQFLKDSAVFARASPPISIGRRQGLTGTHTVLHALQPPATSTHCNQHNSANAFYWVIFLQWCLHPHHYLKAGKLVCQPHSKSRNATLGSGWAPLRSSALPQGDATLKLPRILWLHQGQSTVKPAL